MTLNVSFFIAPWFLLLLFGTIVLGIIIFLTLMQRKMTSEIRVRKDAEVELKNKVLALKPLEDSPQEFLNYLEELTREFFEKYFRLSRNMKFSNYITFFKQNKDKKAVEFCKSLQESLYSGDDIEKERLISLEKKFSDLIDSSKKKKIEITVNNNLPKLPEKKFDKLKQLLSYLNDGKKKGYSFNILRGKLIEQGYKEEEINKAIDRIISQIDAENSKYLNIEKSLRYAPTKLIIKKEDSLNQEKSNLNLKQDKTLQLKKIIQPIKPSSWKPLMPKKMEIKIKKISKKKVDLDIHKEIDSIDDLDHLKVLLKKKELDFTKGKSKLV